MEIHFDDLPSEEEIENILGNDSETIINLANTKQSYSSSELNYLSCYADNINGLNINIDTGDKYDIKDLWSFINISYLRLDLQTYETILDDGDFLSWLLEADNLEAVSIEKLPSDETLHIISSYISLDKKFPVYLFITRKNRRRISRNRKNSPSLYIPPVGLLRAFFVEKIFLNKEKIDEESKNNKNIINKTDHSQFHYYGDVDVAQQKIYLYVESLNIKLHEEIVVTFEGRNINGKFHLEARCLWRNDEGGFYFSSKNIINYKDPYIKEDLCSIKIIDVIINKDGELKFSGIWLTHEENIQINANLKREKSRRLYEELKKELGKIKKQKTTKKNSFTFTV